ncbi:MAG: hypothetical protein GY913_14115 [Proteobacteria bacterium]|nr:hypothetical protein [Pseudomonadota bacterium]MCP4918044.1 hypothetical protein [Pseudomonadota bacterium]
MEGTPWTVDHDDTAWTATTLPHNPALVVGEPDPGRTCWPDFSYEGVTWYRRTFDVGEDLAGLELSLYFEAAGTVATVWINGTEVLSHEGGYLPFVVDLNDQVEVGSEGNVVAVRVDNTDDGGIPPGNESWFNWGGIYRDVWFVATSPLHISDPNAVDVVAGGGVFAWTSHLDDGSATVRVDTHVVNEHADGRTTSLQTSLLDASGEVVATVDTTAEIGAGEAHTFEGSLLVDAPEAWHPDSPTLYTLRSRVYDGEELVDEVETPLGIRTVSFSQEGGLSLNGERFWFRGANRMQDFPYVGYAATDALQAADARLLKEHGFDYVRTSQYPQDPAFLDACDELGLLVMSPIPGFQYVGDATFVARSQDDMRQMIRRDRNRPSVVAWELSLNETDFDSEFAAEAVAIGHDECPHDSCWFAGWAHDEVYDVFIATPEAGARTYAGPQPFVVSEYGHWEYGGLESVTDVHRGDGDWLMADQSWHHMEGHHLNQALPYAAGDGLWAGIDLACYPSGAIDTFRLPKYSAEFFRSQRPPEYGAMVFIASHWTDESNPVPTVFGNCDQVDVYLDGVWVETQAPYDGYPTGNIAHPPYYFVDVPWQRGELRADCVVDAEVAASHTVASPGEPTELTLSTTLSELRADGSDLSFVYAELRDADGTLVIDRSATVSFEIEGGELAGPAVVDTEAGVAATLVRAGVAPGELRVSATASGLESAEATLSLVEAPDLY